MEKVKTWFTTSSFSKMALAGFLKLVFGLVAHAATAGVKSSPGSQLRMSLG